MCSSDKMIKLYAGFRAGCLKQNPLESYFPFAANLICESNNNTVEAVRVREQFRARYNIDLPLTLIRRILDVGVKKHVFTFDKRRGRFVVKSREELEKFRFDPTDFDVKWQSLCDRFLDYVKENFNEVEIDSVDDVIMTCVENYDPSLEVVARPRPTQYGINYIWNCFLIDVANHSQEIFEFITSLCYCNVVKDTDFFDGDARKRFSGLNVYVDSPLIFSVLGMNDKPSVEMCRDLIDALDDAGCHLLLLEHSYQEVLNVLKSAGRWAVSSEYRIDLANNATRYFHDKNYDEDGVREFIANVENELARYRIKVLPDWSYKVDNKFLAKQDELAKALEEIYLRHGYLAQLDWGRAHAIDMDARSILMVRKERKRRQVTDVFDAGHIMISFNTAVSYVSKKYEIKYGGNRDIIPACILADVMGAILWMFSPVQLIEYRKKQLLADCYSAVRPSKELLARFVEELRKAKESGQISPEKFILLKTSSIAASALSKITKGDVANYTEATCYQVAESFKNEVKAELAGDYERQLDAGRKAMESVRKELEQSERARRKDGDDIRSLKMRLKEFQEKEARRFDRKCRIIGMVLSFLIVLIPLIMLEAVAACYLDLYMHDGVFVRRVLITMGLNITLAFVGFMFEGWTKYWIAFVRKRLSEDS